VKKKRVITEKPTWAVHNRTFWLIVICGVAAFCALGARLFDLQVVQHDELEAKAIGQQTRDAVIKASRGTIYDANGKVLAISATTETVYIDPYMRTLRDENAEEIATQLSALLGVDREGIIAKYALSNERGLPIKWKIEGEEAASVRAYITNNKLESVYLAVDTKRYYPQSTLASNVIGFVGVDNSGLEGLEAKYDRYLTGTDGRVVRLKNVSGTDLLFSDYENYYDAENGDDVTLTIDSTIEYYVEKHLAQAIADFSIRGGAACIAVNPKNMEILAMASYGQYGTYDLNAPFDVSEEAREAIGVRVKESKEGETLWTLKDSQELQWQNKSITATYEPGSVFKIITLAMALDEGVINTDSTFFCGGSLSGIPGRPADNPYHCWKHAGHGTQTLTQAIQNSCNVALINIGRNVGAETFYKYIDAFGFFDRTGVDLSGEAGSLWWPDEKFMNPLDQTELASASFGQTFTITPIQLVTAVSAAVNGGELYTPHVVKRVADADGNVVLDVQPQAVRQVISAETSEIVRSILEDVVSTGTGHNAYVKGYRVGGKTGTSEKTAENAKRLKKDPGAEKEYIVSFCGIAPMDDPQIVILLMLDNPAPASQTGIYVSGGQMAAPVVGNILAEVLPYLGVKPQYTEEEAKELNVTVPKLAEKTKDDAEAALDKLGLKVRFVGEGETVTDQLPSPNALVSPGTKVIVYLGESRPDGESVTVPSLTGKSYREAKTALEAAGLFIRSSGVPASTEGAQVSIQSVAAGTEAGYGAVIEVTLVDKNLQGNY
jgi:stage V sporulation protein D (sporulation-specific penicillin-binding protein)